MLHNLAEAARLEAEYRLWLESQQRFAYRVEDWMPMYQRDNFVRHRYLEFQQLDRRMNPSKYAVAKAKKAASQLRAQKPYSTDPAWLEQMARDADKNTR